MNKIRGLLVSMTVVLLVGCATGDPYTIVERAEIDVAAVVNDFNPIDCGPVAYEVKDPRASADVRIRTENNRWRSRRERPDWNYSGTGHRVITDYEFRGSVEVWCEPLDNLYSETEEEEYRR